MRSFRRTRKKGGIRDHRHVWIGSRQCWISVSCMIWVSVVTSSRGGIIGTKWRAKLGNDLIEQLQMRVGNKDSCMPECEMGIHGILTTGH